MLFLALSFRTMSVKGDEEVSVCQPSELWHWLSMMMLSSKAALTAKMTCSKELVMWQLGQQWSWLDTHMFFLSDHLDRIPYHLDWALWLQHLVELCCVLLVNVLENVDFILWFSCYSYAGLSFPWCPSLTTDCFISGLTAPLLLSCTATEKPPLSWSL